MERKVYTRQIRLVITLLLPLLDVIECLPELVHVPLYLDMPGQPGSAAALLLIRLIVINRKGEKGKSFIIV